MSVTVDRLYFCLVSGESGSATVPVLHKQTAPLYKFYGKRERTGFKETFALTASELSELSK